MATKITDLTELSVTAASGDFLHIIDVTDTSGGSAGTSKKIQVSNLPGGGAVTSVNGSVGVVLIGVQDLDDVAGGTPATGDVISYTAGTWVLNSGLQTLLARFKASGTGAQVYDTLNDTTKGYVDVQATSAKIGLAETALTVQQTSPGTLTFSVAAGAAGVETQFNSVLLSGQTTAGTSHLLLRSGTDLRLENASGFETWLRQNPSAASDITVGLPATGGTLALTTDIPSVITVTNQADNRIITATSVNDTLTSESNLTYDGTKLDVTGAVEADAIHIGAQGLVSAGDYGHGAELLMGYTGSAVAGNCLYLRNTGLWSNATASNIGAWSTSFLAIATSSLATTGVLTRGIVYLATDPGGVIGDVVYLSTTNGELSTTPVGTSLNISRVVGYKLATNIIFFNPSQDWIEIS